VTRAKPAGNAMGAHGEGRIRQDGHSRSFGSGAHAVVPMTLAAGRPSNRAAPRTG
jgi:hypothetical protein